MARTGFQQTAYQAALSQSSYQSQQVIKEVVAVGNLVAGLSQMLARLTASLTTPDPAFGVADQADITALTNFLAVWTTVPAAAQSFDAMVTAFLANPPSVTN